MDATLGSESARTAHPDRRGLRVAPALLRTTVPCPLCGEGVPLIAEFRPAEIHCPRCSLSFTHDPWKEPLSVPGVRLASLRREKRPRAEGTIHRSRWKMFAAGAATALAAGLVVAGVWAAMLS